jgi:hypothetical protein
MKHVISNIIIFLKLRRRMFLYAILNLNRIADIREGSIALFQLSYEVDCNSFLLHELKIF